MIKLPKSTEIKNGFSFKSFHLCPHFIKGAFIIDDNHLNRNICFHFSGQNFATFNVEDLLKNGDCLFSRDTQEFEVESESKPAVQRHRLKKVSDHRHVLYDAHDPQH